MSVVEYNVDDRGVGTITLNRPEKLNALSLEKIAELTKIAKSVDAKVRVVILKSSSPKAFCVGADLGERKDMGVDEVKMTLDKQSAMMDSIAAIACPVIASMEGYAFGGGLELALCADLRIIHPEAQLGLTETKLAIIPGAGGTQRLARLLGSSQAKTMIFMGLKISGQKAYDMGLSMGQSENVDEFTQKCVQNLLEAGPLALRAAKEAIDGGLEIGSLKKALEFERACYEKVLNTEDRVEGLKAFAEKRPPQYQGK